MPQRYPAIEPYDQGMLDVGDGHRVYWEVSGNPAGKPALALHGGPGSGSSPGLRRSFDPAVYRLHLYLIMLIEMPSRGVTGADGRARRALLDPLVSAELDTLQHAAMVS